MVRLETDRLVLRPFTEADVDEIYNLIVRNLNPEHITEGFFKGSPGVIGILEETAWREISDLRSCLREERWQGKDERV